jgi:hypothetical protein
LFKGIKERKKFYAKKNRQALERINSGENEQIAT